ncbi:MAG: diguanylate cyclase domain-containing protein [Methylovulum sp.]
MLIRLSFFQRLARIVALPTLAQLRLNFFLTIACFLGGYLGTLIIISANHASPIWPAAGIALAGLVTYGWRVLPGVWVGAFFTQMYSFFDISHLENLQNVIVIGAINGTAATMQAALGTWLVKRYAGAANSLLNDVGILRFMGLAGPVSCVVSATSGLTILYLQGFVSLDTAPSSWLTWWIGDTIGVLIFTPLVLCFIGIPRNEWRPRITSVALPLAVLSLLVAALFQLGKQEEHERISKLFNERTSLLQNALQNEFNRYIEINRTLKAFFDSATQITPDEFRIFAQTVMNSNSTIQSLAWIPRINAENQSVYQQLLGKTFVIQTADGNKIDLSAAFQRNYFPIVYLEPFQDNKQVWGLDVGSKPTQYKMLESARDSRATVAAKMDYPPQESGSHHAIVIYTPIYQTNQPLQTQEQRRRYLSGFVASSFVVDDTVNEVKNKLGELELLLKITDAGISLFDESVNDTKKSTSGLPPLEKSASINLAGHLWNVNYRAAPEFYSSQYLWNIWWLILSGFLIIGLTGLGLLMLTGRNMQTESVIKIRTQELENEIAQRKKIIQQRNDQNLVLQAIVSPNSLGDILTLIIKLMEQNYPDSLCSILLLDEQGKHLYLGAASSLPEFYNQAIDGIAVAYGQGSCGTAVYLGQRVIVEDIQHHPYWRGFSELAKRANLAACWSEPIISSTQQVLGAFAIYHRTPYCPDATLLSEVNDYAKLASIAIEKKYSEEQIANMAFFDPLTNLPNRRLFLDRLEKALSKGLRHKTYGAILYLDLDNFKALNDTFGHHIGDELLIQVAKRLKECIRDEDTVARLGGDEFVILLNCNELTLEIMLEHALTMAERVQSSLQKTYQLKEHSYQITPSIGITLMPQADVSPDDLLKQADTAMYYAKNRGRNTIRFYKEDMQRHADLRLMMEKDLREALSNQQLSLRYQPQFDGDERLIGAEALLYWQHPVKGAIPSADFIAIAEEAGIMQEISEWTLREACLQLQKWPHLPYVAVKLSARQFQHLTFDEQMVNVLVPHNTVMPHLILEISGGAIIENIDNSIAELQAINNLGMSTAMSIEDFIICCSSLSYLKLLPLNQIKINQSFACHIEIDAIIVETMTAMARHFGLSVIAEAVETAEQFQCLKDKGCTGYQGPFFSEPLTPDEFNLGLWRREKSDGLVVLS